MCQFFSFLSDSRGNYYYADNKLRKEILAKKAPSWFENADSHSSLARFFIKNGAEDNLNAYEFNPLTKVFTKDKINIDDDSTSAEKWVNELNFSRIVPELRIKEIVHPFKLPMVLKPTKKDIILLRSLVSVRGSVRGSVWDSVWDSVGGYISTFFDIKYKFDFSNEGKMWLKGMVPSFDGELWRLHSGEKAKIILEITPNELRKYK